MSAAAASSAALAADHASGNPESVGPCQESQSRAKPRPAASAPLALLVAFLAGLLLWRAMGRVIVRERVPAFIITLGGLLIFKGLFWRVIENSTIPVAPGGVPNLYSALTTWYLPKPAGWALLALAWAALAADGWRHRLEGDTEAVILPRFVAGQAPTATASRANCRAVVGSRPCASPRTAALSAASRSSSLRIELAGSSSCDPKDRVKRTAGARQTGQSVWPLGTGRRHFGQSFRTGTYF